MTQSRKRAVVSLFMWSIVSVVFLVLFFQGGGPELFGEDGPRLTYSVMLIMAAFAGHFIMIYLTKQGAGRPVVKDERDDSIARKANGTTLIVILLYVYLLSIALWEVYRDAGAVPVGWVWFLAYFTVAFGSLVHAVVTLFLDVRGESHAQS